MKTVIILRNLLAQEDECAYDAYYQFDRDVLKHTIHYNPNTFKAAATKCTSIKEGKTSYLLHHKDGRVFEMEWAINDPYWKLYEHIETTSLSYTPIDELKDD